VTAIKNLAIALTISALAACADTVNINSDYFEGSDFSQFKTYRWYDDVHESRTAEYRSYNSSDKLMRQTVNAALKKKGLRPNTLDGGEFLVNYRISADAKMNMNSFNSYDQPGVHGGVATGTYGTSVALGVSTGSGPTYYKEGTIVIDIIDVASNSVVWRGVADGRLPKDMGLSKRNEIIRQIVPRILEDFPPQ
jgi:hypothetical protein